MGKDQHRSLHLTRCPWPHQASKRRESTRLCSITILFTWLLPLLPLYSSSLRHYTESNRFTLQMEDQWNKEEEGKKDIWSCVKKCLDYYQNVKNLICTNNKIILSFNFVPISILLQFSIRSQFSIFVPIFNFVPVFNFCPDFQILSQFSILSQLQLCPNFCPDFHFSLNFQFLSRFSI